MDVFQLTGDFLHLIAILMLLLKIMANRNVIGISYRTQEIYLIVFITRYSDLIFEHQWGSLYFNVMKILFIGITIYIIFMMKCKRPYKLVKDYSIRVMTKNQTIFLIGHYISFHLC